jgi:hypothetical protein
MKDLLTIKPGDCAVLTRKFGDISLADDETNGERDPNTAEEKASQDESRSKEEADSVLGWEDKDNRNRGKRGILPNVLGPGSYRINPYAYSYEVIPAVEVRVDQIGVRTLKVGLDPGTLPKDEKRGHYVVPAGYRGAQQDIAAPGTHYINKYVETITPVEVRSHRVELSDIQFPSRDGFILQPHVVVEYAVIPDKAPELIMRLTDDGILNQEDATPEQQEQNEILQKVILPHIRGYARLEGSNFDARDFILIETVAPEGAAAAKVDNAREVLQKALLAKVKPRCEELGIEIRAVTVADMRPPSELAEQIAERELARVELQKNSALVQQHKSEQELAAKTALKQQAREKVAAETRLIQAKTQSQQLKTVEQSRLTQELANAALTLEAAKQQAQAMLVKGQAEASVIQQQNEAEVAGLRTAVQGFGSPGHYAQYQVISRLGPALAEVFASDESEFARLVTNYLTAPPRSSASPSDATKTAGEVTPATTAPATAQND